MKTILTGTHVDSHGEAMAREALESAAAQINGLRAIPVGVDHDSTVPPMGKLFDARVEPADDGEFVLVANQEVFEHDVPVRLPDGTLAQKQSSKSDVRPFVARQIFDGEGLGIAYDGVNFASDQDLEAFMSEVTFGGELDVDEHDFMRKSVIPDPEIIVGLAKALGTYLIGRKVFDKLGGQIADDVGNDLSKFYRFIRSAVVGAAKYCIPKNRPITYVFVAVEKPIVVEFVAQSTDPEFVIRHVTLHELDAPIERAFEYHATIGAEKVQFILHESGTWDFNYLLTSSGEVIGSPASFGRRAKRIKLLRDAQKLPDDDKRPVRRAFRKRKLTVADPGDSPQSQ